MSARAVVAFREPFLPRVEEYADAGVARDEIMSLQTSEPAVLRVSVSGGGAPGRAALAGDWLCDDGGRTPKPLPDGSWIRSNGRGRVWFSRPSNLLDEWEGSESPFSLLHTAVALRLRAELAVGAACACARMVVGRIRRRDHALLAERALSAVEEWIRRAVRPVDLDAYVAAGDAVDRELRAMYEVVPEARESAFACVVEVCRAVRETPMAVSYAAHYAAESLGAGAELASAVRSAIPTIDVLRAAIFIPASEIRRPARPGGSRRGA